MDEKNLTASQFAEEIGVQRATMSHIVNGRNNPSLDIVSRILKCYPEIDPLWLINGVGEMHVHKEEPVLQYAPNTAKNPMEGPGTLENRKEFIVDGHINHTENINNEQLMSFSAVPKKISKIMVFYSDNTFDTFVSEKSKKDS